MRIKPFSSTIDQTKRDEILDAALRVFQEVGFKEATVRQICKKAKANVCLVSYYFDGKEGLYRAVFERVYESKASTFRTLAEDIYAIQTQEEYQARLKLHVERLHENMLKDADFFKLIQREILEGMPRAEDIIRGFFGMSREFLVNYINFGIKRKFVKKDIDPELAVSGLMSLLTGFVQQQNLGKPDMFFPNIPSKEIPESISKIIITIFFNGVMQ